MMLPCDVDILQDKKLDKTGHYLVCCTNINIKNINLTFHYYSKDRIMSKKQQKILS